MKKLITDLEQKVYEIKSVIDNGASPIFIPRKHHHNANNKRRRAIKNYKYNYS